MLQIYSTLSRKKEILKPLNEQQVRMYVCGMTVYDYCHLGHARMLVSFDVVQRWLRASGYDVRYVRNVTDIDDKIIRKAVQLNKPLKEVTDFYTDAMHADERALSVESPDIEPRATQHIGSMLDIIQRLEEKNLAYQGDHGDVNYAVRGFEGYGKLSGHSPDDLRSGERIAVSSSKRDPLDFVLWKSAKEEEPADSKWESPYGLGRPGWHIECSAMSRDLLGESFDIHGGGPDLKFPHHENEIAQSEGAFGGQMAQVWMHCGPLMVDDEKMSKSLGNFLTIRQAIGVNPEATSSTYEVNPREAQMLRFFIVRNHYRSMQNFAPNNLMDAQLGIDRLYQTLKVVAPTTGEFAIDWNNEFALRFKSAMNDDFNSALAVSVLFELATHVNKAKDHESARLLQSLGSFLGILQMDPEAYFKTATRYSDNAPAEQLSEADIEAAIEARKQAKADKDYAKADDIRKTLRESGVELEDKAGGVTLWRRV